MRKWIIGAIILTSMSSAFAEDFIAISRSNKLGATVVDRVSKEGEKYFLNYQVLPKNKNKAARNYWVLARAIKSSAQCEAGKFVIVREELKQRTEIAGCAYGDEYGKLIAALYQLK